MPVIRGGEEGHSHRKQQRKGVSGGMDSAGGAVWAVCERVEDDMCLLCAERPRSPSSELLPPTFGNRFRFALKHPVLRIEPLTIRGKIHERFPDGECVVLRRQGHFPGEQSRPLGLLGGSHGL